MKRLFLLITVITMTVAANAISFRSKQQLCSGNERIIFYTNGTYELYNGSMLKYSGSYTVIMDERVVKMTVDGVTLRMSAGITSGAQKCTSISFRDPDTGKYTNYHPCN